MSQYSILQSLGNASAVAVSPINADATLTAGITLNSSLWAGVGVFNRGKPFTVLGITKSNYLDVLGEPLKPSAGPQFEPLRHVYEAVEQTAGYVVRVVADDAKFPIITFDEFGVPAYSALPFGSEVDLDSGEAFGIYVDDGDPCVSPTRELTLEKTDPDGAGNVRFIVTLTQTSSLGVVNTLESHTVSFAEDAKDDMGRLCYLPTALEARSRFLRAVVNADLIATATVKESKGLKFTGGTNGDQSKISTQAYLRAVKALDNAPVMYTAVLGLGCYDNAAITALGDICTDRLIDGFFDVKPTLTNTEAIKAVADTGLLGIDHVSCCVYHFPFTCKDKWTQSRVVFGLSGAAYAAKARGVKKNSDIGGWHYSPAGEERGVIARASVQPLYPEDKPDEEAMVTGRLNKVAISTTGQMIIDDALTCCTQNNYLRFQHVPSLMNAISRFFVQLARQLKHSPDGITEEGLRKGMVKLLDRFVAAKALVEPRDPDSDGTEPYVLKVTQAEFDKWELEWACCPTGVARRIQGIPVLIK
ncbi:hypothetical protein ACEZ6Q_004449 [Salmonella enterica]|nr:hypothetical protein [Salmonella enterica]EBQ9479069.1 hypothetical protein [Salmonella enterica subsp. enterica serovar Kokomlemle]EDB5955436.1 hypothetical protein [Salmonella enterica subsp. enterica serovar Bareilly]